MFIFKSLRLCSPAGHALSFFPSFFLALNLTSLFLHAEEMDQDNNTVVSEQSSHHALRRRCMSALAVSSTQASVVLESTPVLLEVLSSAHTGNVSRQRASS